MPQLTVIYNHMLLHGETRVVLAYSCHVAASRYNIIAGHHDTSLVTGSQSQAGSTICAPTRMCKRMSPEIVERTDKT